MEIRFIGTGSIGASRFSASTLINKEILIDAPNGVVKKIKSYGEDVQKIKTIFITHLHGDHFLDLPFIALEKFFYKSEENLTIYCPFGTKEKFKQLFDLAFPGDYDKVMSQIDISFIEFENLENEKVLEKYTVKSVEVNHGELKPAYGYLIESEGNIIGFSGDSGICENIDYIVKQSDISVLDMSFTDNTSNSHMRLEEIKELCKKHLDKKIIATHMHDYTREFAQNNPMDNLIIPEDGDVIYLEKN